MLDKVYERQAAEGRPKDLEEAVEIGDARLKKMDRLLSWTGLPFNIPIPEGIGVKLHDLYFPSPLTLSSFKDDLHIMYLWMRLGLGGATLKTTMHDKRDGNPRPRLQEVGTNGVYCLLNAMGLPGKGAEAAATNPANKLLFRMGRPVGISIGGSSLEEYGAVFDIWNHYLSLRPAGDQYYFEINISCPNTPDGQQIAKHTPLLEELLRNVRRKTSKVIGVKLSPDQSNESIANCAWIAHEHHPSYVNLGNTSFRKCQEVGLPSDAISKGGGGFSGPRLYHRTLQMIDLVSSISIPIIATGGIDSAQKVREVRDHGATLVGMATAVVQDMYCIPRINYELAKKK